MYTYIIVNQCTLCVCLCIAGYPRYVNIRTYFVQVEKVMFEAATNREEYYKLLAQKIYHIRKELEDRKNQKKPPNKGTSFLHKY